MDKKNDKFKTEHAAEFVPNKMNYKEFRGDETAYVTGIWGYLGVIASIISLFTYPVTLGILGAFLGFVSVFSGAKTLGYTAIAIGLLSSLSSLLFRVALLSFILSILF
ncbi:hypothetical protein SAMN05661008_00043 [Alkalithermobacter thermoalcaliphilus JW-YL-7 = DSM 7308]|uniref:DUF4190 domain-containing protein n=1 Tax=Alkalithermobacter thermoalcaliphilus JW-YL-7 = DSM 7308 TaxID=1121328 RepID=A0A150FS08_CLOPD|nr:hypothetical protein JWYL7_1478 [[Clostridium] paradoxum JW-YL-7 = DSM 7308]SHK34075.1 hypothetical protein SAMN05661008_00043 [[Clostridium] paradoxum JW-YL-7 = DSM 7308]